MPVPRLEIPPYDVAAAARLEREVGVGHVLAQVLVRRGYATPAAARAFLAADEEHDAAAFDGIERAVDLILAHARAGSPIVVHGDYDVDGVASTAILVRTLRLLGAQVGWFLPSRLEDGYGLSGATGERLAARGTGLLVTADCAITAVEEVAAARAAGMDVVVTDHHAPRADGVLPDAPVVHPVVGGYPCAELCAAGVAYKLAGALLAAGGRDAAEADDDLDLVGLATIADVVPLCGENRRLARAGLRALAATPKPGLRALLRVARVDPSGLDAHAAAFRLAPRINAAGRLHRADAGVELALTQDEERAAAIAAELDAANAERRAIEERTRFDAERQVAEQGERRGYVLAGEGWHPGVVGIVASRVAERHHRPAVLVALDGARGTGSARSIPGFDLLGALRACGEHLGRFGGHRAAAGLELEAERLEAFRAAFDAHAASVLSEDDLVPVERIDAVVPGGELGADLAEDLARMEPCGAGNPSVNLLVPAATCEQPRPLGDGRHLRFSLRAGGGSAKALCFGASRLPVETGEPCDAVVTLALEEWKGTVEPKLVLRSARPCEPAEIEVVGEPEDYVTAAFAELDAPLPADAAAPARLLAESRRTLVDRRGLGVAGVIADVVASGEPVLVVCADLSRRLAGLRDRLGGFAMCEHDALARDPGLAARHRHLVVLDPPAEAEALERLRRAPGGGWVHLAHGDAETDFARRVLEHRAALRDHARALYAALRDGVPLERALRGEGPHPRPAAEAGRLLRILVEVGVAAVDRAAPSVSILPSQGAELARSEAFRSYTREYERRRRCLGESTARAA